MPTLLNNANYILLNQYVSRQHSFSSSTNYLAYINLFFHLGNFTTEYQYPPHSLWLTGLMYAQMNNQEKAVQVWEKMPDGDSRLVIMAQNARLKGQSTDALYWLYYADFLNPTSPDIWYEKGLTYEALGLYEPAQISWHMALVNNPSLENTNVRDVYCALGWYYHWLAPVRKPKQALVYYTAALSRTDDLESPSLCYWRRAELYLWYLQQPLLAQKDYEMVVQFGGQPYPALVNAAWAGYLGQLDGVYTESVLFDLIAEYPHELLAYERLLMLYGIQNEQHKASLLLQRAEKSPLHPTDISQLQNMWLMLTSSK
ncbi:MAG: hypothetical protein OT477_12365 [Chloroflexi bacterium]|nr:hypothetical protein [Chloroflexota bacterium]